MPRRRHGHGWSRRRPPPLPETPPRICKDVQTSPRLKHYYDFRILHIRPYRGVYYSSWVTIASSPLPPIHAVNDV